jgi:hypothetical protein
MADTSAIKSKIDELDKRTWDSEGITARFRKMEKEGIPQKELKKDDLLSEREEILDRVQLLAEEYYYKELCPGYGSFSFRGVWGGQHGGHQRFDHIPGYRWYRRGMRWNYR